MRVSATWLMAETLDMTGDRGATTDMMIETRPSPSPYGNPTPRRRASQGPGGSPLLHVLATLPLSMNVNDYIFINCETVIASPTFRLLPTSPGVFLPSESMMT